MAPKKSDPVTVTGPPPEVGPLWGTTDGTWGETKVYSLSAPPHWSPRRSPEVVTVTASLVAERTSGVATVTEVGVWAHRGDHPPEADHREARPETVACDDHRGAPGGGAGIGARPVTDGHPALDPENRLITASARGGAPARGQVIAGGGRIERRRGRGPGSKRLLFPTVMSLNGGWAPAPAA